MTPSHPLQRPFERQMRAFGKHLPRAVEGDVEPLHQCRVATRRLREVLPLIASEVPRGVAARARRRLRRVGNALGGVREADVTLAVIAEVTGREVIAGEAADRLRQHVQDERDEWRERMLDRLRAVNTRKLERDLAEVARELGMRGQTETWPFALASRIRRRARRVRAAVNEAGSLYVPDRVHAVRIATKKLRYALEFAGAAGLDRTKGAVRRAKEIQETLGRLHDLEVVVGTMQDLTVPGSAVEPWQTDLAGSRRALDRECRELHGRYVARREALQEVCAAADRVAGRIAANRTGELPTAPMLNPAGRVLKMRLPEATPARRKVPGDRG